MRDHARPVPWEDAPLDVPQSLKAQQLYRVVDGDRGEGLFTGYYEPELQGSRTPHPGYPFPVYALPDLPQAFSRAEIEAGALRGKGLELLYVASAADLFFMHIQGSGCIRFADGSCQRLGFAGKNGRPYTAIGTVLKERGLLAPPITMQSIRHWLAAHPGDAQAMMNANASYIFFRPHAAAGPIGASGEVLVAEESLAIDHTLWPYGVPAIVATTHPITRQPFIRLMRTADTGSAIRGPIRGDIFFGAGSAAAEAAGAMQAQGKLWLILPKD